MILSVEIDGNWTARNLADVLNSLESLAHFAETGYVIKPEGFSVSGGTVTSIPGEPKPTYLKVSRLAFNSPGSIDLLGIAKVVQEIRLFLEFLINLYVQRNARELDHEERKIEIQNRRAEVQAKLSEQHSHLSQIVEEDTVDPLIEAVLERRITSVDAQESD